MQRLVLIGRLKPGAEEAAAALIAQGPPFDPQAHGFGRHSVFLASSEVVFLFEGDEVEWEIDEIVDEPFGWPVSEALEHWAPLIDGPPHIAREVYFWERAPEPVE